MRIPISWLGEYVDLPEDVTHEHVHAALVKVGLEEEDVHGAEITGPVVVGRTHIKTMDLYSSVCAVQNLWLAARAEGLGVGWVSIFNQPELQQALGMPAEIVPIAYLCIGYVSHFNDKPELEKAGWLPRLPVEELVYFEQWGATDPGTDSPLTARLNASSSA